MPRRPKLPPPPTEGEVFAHSLLENVSHAIARAVANEREECIQTAERVIEPSNRDSLVSCTAITIADLLRKRR